MYTRNAHFEPLSGIHAGAKTSSLEKFFNNTLYNISAEYGSVGHLQTVFANDDWSAVCVLVSYSEGKIKSIEAWDDNTYGDKVPVVPKSENIERYIEDNKQRINRKAEHAFEEDLTKINRQGNNYEGTKHVDKEITLKLTASKVIIISFSIGVVLSLLAVLTYKVLSDKYTQQTKALNNTINKDEEYINTEFSENTPENEFDYPYEDIGDVLR